MGKTSNNEKGSVSGNEAKDEKIEYPDGLQNSEEVKQQQVVIDDLLKEYRNDIISARDAYRKAFEFLKVMGTFQSNANKRLEEIAKEVDKLKVMIIKPLI